MTDEVLKAALEYCKVAPVFPVRRKRAGAKWRKVPVFKGWQDLASTDPEQVTIWFDLKYPQPDVGVAVLTGERSRLFLLDIDSPDGHSGVDGFKSLRELKKRAGLKLDRAPGWITQTNGNSFLFRLAPGQIVKSSTSVLGPGIDTKGSGSFAVLPPSRLDLDRPPYQWLNGFRLQDVQPLPSEILELLQKKRTAEYSALEAACDSIRSAPTGTGHDAIVAATWQVAAHVLSGKLALGEALDALNAAALERGHDRLEVETALEGALAKRRTEAAGKSGKPLETPGMKLPEDDPWETAVDGSKVLEDGARLVNTFVAMPAGGISTSLLWCLHVHAFDAFSYTPRLLFTSPVPECGKSVALLDMVGNLVPRPLPIAAVTAASLFRSIRQWSPTLLIDEMDNADLALAGDLRTVINHGNRRGNAIPRVAGDDHHVELFPVFAPIAMAAIGDLVKTVASRSIIIPMARLRKGEKKVRFTPDDTRKFTELRRHMKRLAIDNQDALAKANPAIPPELSSRQADNWRPLFAIADLAGGEWPAQLRKAAIALSKTPHIHSDDRAEMALVDCYAVLCELVPDEVLRVIVRAGVADFIEVSKVGQIPRRDRRSRYQRRARREARRHARSPVGRNGPSRQAADQQRTSPAAAALRHCPGCHPGKGQCQRLLLAAIRRGVVEVFDMTLPVTSFHNRSTAMNPCFARV